MRSANSNELASYIKCIKDQHMHFNVTDAIFLPYGHQLVAATHVAIFRVISLRTRNYNLSGSPYSIKNCVMSA